LKAKKQIQKKVHPLRQGDLIVDVDWSSTGIWLCYSDGKTCNASYEGFEFPKSLIERFHFWTAWHDNHSPWNGETIDYDLFRAYGRALAVDVKRIVKDETRVFYGFYAGKKLKCQVSEEEILLPEK
jgi:hypothetical protein